MNQKSKSLLSRLHHLTSHQDENFLTESLAYILSIYLVDEPQSAICLLRYICSEKLLIPKDNLNSVNIHTQFLTKYGTPDLVLSWTDSIVFIEVKVDSGFGIEQLDRYRSALLERSENNKALVTLTRYPLNTLEGNVDHSIRWFKLAELFNDLSPEGDVGKYLKNEFLMLLRYRGLIMDSISSELAKGVYSFRCLIDMLEEAVRSNGLSIYQRSGAWDWQGFYVDNKRLFIGIYFSEPTIISINTEIEIPEPIPEDITFGKIENNKWSCSLKIINGDEDFFEKTQGDQLLYIEGLIKEPIKYALEHFKS